MPACQLPPSAGPYDYRDEQLTDRRAVITTAFVTSTGVSALAAAAIYAARETSSRTALEGRPNPSLVALAGLTLPLLAVAKKAG